MDEAQRKKLEAGKKRLEEFRKKKEAQEAASGKAAGVDGDNQHIVDGGETIMPEFLIIFRR